MIKLDYNEFNGLSADYYKNIIDRSKIILNKIKN